MARRRDDDTGLWLALAVGVGLALVLGSSGPRARPSASPARPPARRLPAPEASGPPSPVVPLDDSARAFVAAWVEQQQAQRQQAQQAAAPSAPASPPLRAFVAAWVEQQQQPAAPASVRAPLELLQAYQAWCARAAEATAGPAAAPAPPPSAPAPADIGDLIRALKDAQGRAPRTASAEMTELLELLRRTAKGRAAGPAAEGAETGEILGLAEDAPPAPARARASDLAVSGFSSLRRSDLSGLAAHADIPAGFRTPPGMALPSPDAILGAEIHLSEDSGVPLGLSWDEGTKAWIS